MRGRTSIFAFLLLSAFHAPLEAACIDPATLAHSAVSITRYFDERERAATPGLIGTSGTAWFLSPTMIVTAEHVSSGMLLTTQNWKQIDIGDRDEISSVSARIARVVGSGAEKLAVLELQSEFPGARSAAIRPAPLAPDEQVVTFAYPSRHPRVVSGRFVRYGEEGSFAGAALFEIYDGNDRLAIDHGASGAPVYDCEGRIAAVVSTVITQTFPGLRIRVSTAWGTPNVLSVPIQALREYSELQ
jgi:hypothetical protein